jgi:hypothetical protein
MSLFSAVRNLAVSVVKPIAASYTGGLSNTVFDAFNQPQQQSAGYMGGATQFPTGVTGPGGVTPTAATMPGITSGARQMGMTFAVYLKNLIQNGAIGAVLWNGTFKGVIQKGGKFITAFFVGGYAARFGVAAAAALFGVAAEYIAHALLARSQKNARHRRRGISWKQLSTTRRTLHTFNRMNHLVQHACAPTRPRTRRLPAKC